jgi:probable HAF family extracellular repeat protein
MKTKISSLCVAAAFGFVLNASAGVTITNLWANSTLGGFSSFSYGGSSDGWTSVGDSETAIGDLHGFFANGGTMYDIGTLSGGYSSRAYDMAWNPSLTAARVVGYSEYGSTYPSTYHAISIPLSSTGGPTVDLGTLGGPNSYAYDVNRSFQIVGESEISSAGYVRAFLYSGGVMTNLGTFPGGSNSYAFGISESGKVVGSAATTSAYHAFVYSGGVMTDIGTLGGTNSRAFAINDTGGIVGDSNIAGPGYVTRAFLYKNGTMTNLGTLNSSSYSSANDVNSAGEVVGFSTYSASSNTHAFLYKNGVMYDLHAIAASAGLLSNGSTVGFVSLDYANAVNDGKYVVGTGMYYDGSSTNYRSFVLKYTAN